MQHTLLVVPIATKSKQYVVRQSYVCNCGQLDGIVIDRQNTQTNEHGANGCLAVQSPCVPMPLLKGVLLRKALYGSDRALHTMLST